jgi:hypothetical protein
MKHYDCCSEAGLGGIVDDHREGHAVELLLDLAALLTAGLTFAHFLKKGSELRTANELQREIQLERVAHALKQEADGTGARTSEELAVKPLSGAREILGVVAGSGGGEARGVQLALGVGESLVVASFAKVLQESREHVGACERQRPAHVPLRKKPTAPAQIELE